LERHDNRRDGAALEEHVAASTKAQMIRTRRPNRVAPLMKGRAVAVVLDPDGASVGRSPEKKESTFSPGWDEEKGRRALAHYEPQTREKPVGPNSNRLTSVCRQRRDVETLDKSLRQRENRATYWNPKDVIGRPAYQ
jgi:hypothetical protein